MADLCDGRVGLGLDHGARYRSIEGDLRTPVSLRPNPEFARRRSPTRSPVLHRRGKRSRRAPEFGPFRDIEFRWRNANRGHRDRRRAAVFLVWADIPARVGVPGADYTVGELRYFGGYPGGGRSLPTILFRRGCPIAHRPSPPAPQTHPPAHSRRYGDCPKGRLPARPERTLRIELRDLGLELGPLEERARYTAGRHWAPCTWRGHPS